ncbi:MAG TPA: GxxExxY protein [Tepidisphaeraceae bacterium]|jgi:GxxExxY protein|nr:GxxExxY protein [Tepidisphaeraceae bacterium]
MLLSEDLTERIIAAAIEVHRILGPGLLESSYKFCLAHEFMLQGIRFGKEIDLPVVCKGVSLDCGYRMDFVIEETVVLEVKAIDKLGPIHEPQLITYLRLSGKRIGLLINFSAPVLRNQIMRRVL